MVSPRIWLNHKFKFLKVLNADELRFIKTLMSKSERAVTHFSRVVAFVAVSAVIGCGSGHSTSGTRMWRPSFVPCTHPGPGTWPPGPPGVPNQAPCARIMIRPPGAFPHFLHAPTPPPECGRYKIVHLIVQPGHREVDRAVCVGSWKRRKPVASPPPVQR